MLGQRPDHQLELFCYRPAPPPTALHAKLEAARAALDWDAVRARAQAWFDPRLGRPSVDPVVVVKLCLLKALTGLASWRALVEFASDSLAARWFLGYDWHELLPAHSTLCEWRERLGPEFFEDLLGDVVLHCVRHGMVLSGVRVVDASTVRAQAGREGPSLAMPAGEDAPGWVAAYEVGLAKEAVKDEPQRRVSPHDPEAQWGRKGNQPAQFGYQVSYASDPLSQLVVTSIVKPTEQPATLVEHLLADPGEVREVGADSLYDAAEPLAAAAALGVQALVPRKRRGRGGHGFGHAQFVYDREGDFFTCPGGCRLLPAGQPSDGQQAYRARAADCAGCRLKRWCTDAKRRCLSRQVAEHGRERCLRGGPRYDQVMGYRRTQEHLWRCAKRDHGLGRADGLGLGSVRIQAALVAVAIDLGKLLRFQAEPRAKGPAASGAAGLVEVAVGLVRDVQAAWQAVWDASQCRLSGPQCPWAWSRRSTLVGARC